MLPPGPPDRCPSSPLLVITHPRSPKSAFGLNVSDLRLQLSSVNQTMLDRVYNIYTLRGKVSAAYEGGGAASHKSACGLLTHALQQASRQGNSAG